MATVPVTATTWFNQPGNGLLPPRLSLNGPTGVPPFALLDPSELQTLSAGYLRLNQPYSPTLRIQYPITLIPVTMLQPTEYTRMYSPEIYQVVFNRLTEGQSVIDTLAAREPMGAMSVQAS